MGRNKYASKSLGENPDPGVQGSKNGSKIITTILVVDQKKCGYSDRHITTMMYR